MRAVASIFIWVVAALTTTAVFLVSYFIILFLLPFDKKRKLAHAQGFWWADVIVGLNPFWHLDISGLEHIDPRKTYVIVANHQSVADIVIVYKTHIQFKWIAKESLFKIPIFGGCLSLAGHIPLARGELSSIRDAYEVAGEWLRKGISVLFFPEGTRSDSGHINPFKNGAFKLAIKEKKPILPIYIGGSRNVIPRGSWIFKSNVNGTLRVLPEIDTSKFTPEDYERLRDETHARISACLNPS